MCNVTNLVLVVSRPTRVNALLVPLVSTCTRGCARVAPTAIAKIAPIITSTVSNANLVTPQSMVFVRPVPRTAMYATRLAPITAMSALVPWGTLELDPILAPNVC